MSRGEKSMWKVTSVSLSRYEAKVDPRGIAGYRRVEESMETPSWAAVQQYIERLDGQQCTEMSLDGPHEYHMTIGGGPDRFFVSVIGNDLGPYTLLGPDPSDQPQKMILGGIETDVPRRFHATREQTLQAAEYFFYHGQIDPNLNWQLG
jgi:hypothetical protein